MTDRQDQTDARTREQADGWHGVPHRDATAVDGQEARITPAPSADSADAQPTRPAQGGTPGGCPAPQYGEYAPEGWVNPVLVEQERQERLDRERAAASGPTTGADRGDRRRGPEGRTRSTGDRPDTAVRPTSADRADASHRPGGRTDGAGAPVRRLGASPVDVLLTFVLLAMGLVSVVQSLSISSVASAVRQTLETNYTALQDPGSLNGAAMVSAVGMLVVYALTLWWSVVRLRAAKRTFWVPLLGGAVATVFSTIVFVVVVFQDGGFVSALMQHAAG